MSNNPPPPHESDPSLNKDVGYGYDMYPERRGTFKRTWYKVLFGVEGRESEHKIKCEMNVYKCLQTSYLVRLMMAALKSAGCEIDIRRHIVCEVCTGNVTGGYDPELNQIVICQNTSLKTMVQGILAHEMIHMFDWCQNKLDFRNMEHLACTEIRAANLTHCSFLSSFFQGISSPFNIKQTHRLCVRQKAVHSVMAARKAPEEVAEAVVDKVFDKCYADLEPVGRRLRRNSTDMERAYYEGPLYGYYTDGMS